MDNKLRDSLQALCRVYRKAGAHGLMFIQYGDKDNALLPRRAYRNKIVIPLKEDVDRININIDRLAKTIALGSGKSDAAVMRSANWFFVEYTAATPNLTQQYSTVGDGAFKGQPKHVVYFDMDIKGQVNAEVYKTMSREEKKLFVEKNKEKLDVLIKETHPMYLLFTGNGLHIGYMVEDMIFSSKQWKGASLAYTEAYKIAMTKLRKLTNWVFDEKCSSISRVDRVPYTINVKSPRPQEDTYAELLYMDENADGAFLKFMARMVESPELSRKVADDSSANFPMYMLLPTLRDANPFVYKHLHAGLSFKKVFEHFEILDALHYPTNDDEIGGFQTCFSPFRRSLFGMETESEEHIPSFRFDEVTKKFYDFGVIPNTDNNSGDAAGLAYALTFYKKNGTWPERVNHMEAVDAAMAVIGKKTVADLREELTGFLRDDNGNVIADFDSVARVAVYILLNKYELVFNKVQQQFFFREIGAKSDFRPFPWECTEFGNKDKATSARLILTLSGIGNPSSALLATAKHIVDAITDPHTVRLTPNGLHAYFDMEAVREITFPVIDLDNPVIRFSDGVYYHVRTGDIASDYEGYAYNINVSHRDVVNSNDCPYFDLLLESLVGKEGSPERMVFKYLLAQMWFKAHGDSRALVIKGVGRNGKSTLIEVLMEVLPQGVAHSCDMSVLTGEGSADTASRMDFLGKHLVVVDDVSEHKLSLKLKPLITGGGGVVAKLLFKNPITFKNTASFLLMTNSFPKIQEDISAFLRRFLVIESKVKVRKVIPNLKQMILEKEQPAVWAYIINAVEYFREQHNFAFPEQEQWAKELLIPMKRSLINQMSTGEIALSLKPCAGKVISVRDLYEFFLDYSEVIGAKKSSLKNFSDRLVSIIEGDSEIYGENWEEDFMREGMDETFVVVYRNGQAEYFVNFDFTSPINLVVPAKVVQPIDAVVGIRGKAGDIRCQSVKYPISESSEILQRLKAWKDSQNSLTGDASKFKPLPVRDTIPFTPTRTYERGSGNNSQEKPAAKSGDGGIDLL